MVLVRCELWLEFSVHKIVWASEVEHRF